MGFAALYDVVVQVKAGVSAYSTVVYWGRSSVKDADKVAVKNG